MTTKFIPSSRAVDILLENGEGTAYQDYDEKLEAMGSKDSPIHRYDFNRGFEYGAQWALDNIGLLMTITDEMPAGQEMDMLIAEKVMNWKQLSNRLWHDDDGNERWIDADKSFIHQPCWSPSTNIADAWEIMEGVSSFRLVYYRGKWECTIIAWGAEGATGHFAEADTGMLAICRAALKAVENPHGQLP